MACIVVDVTDNLYIDRSVLTHGDCTAPTETFWLVTVEDEIAGNTPQLAQGEIETLLVSTLALFAVAFGIRAVLSILRKRD